MAAPPPLPQSLKKSLEQSKCEYRQLGNSGLRISVPVFGCMSFGDTKAQSWAIDEADVSDCELSDDNPKIC